MNLYTAFCQGADGRGTLWIDTVEAESVDEAVQLAIEHCANNWDCGEDEVHCLGIAGGDVDILFWDDFED